MLETARWRIAGTTERVIELRLGNMVEVVVACEEDLGMVIVVRDPGPGFNPESVPSPVVGENIYADSGRGIFLINQLMDEVRFEKNGTELWMIKGRSNPAQ